MNYVILNGVKSTEISGLLIQSLPPISKPLIRTQVEEIDGRDGDIITKLGYAAYDRDISIGLYGDYDVDDVIEFFNSDGIVIFSNEPDKYYNYQIINQIDFEKLIRFKTATVKFHVQPFKYSAVDKPITQNFTEASQSITLSNMGNTVSRPAITLTGSGTVNLSLNGEQIFVIDINDYITIDSENMEAVSNGLLANRSVTGDYNNFVFNVGKNTLSWTGNVTEIEIDRYSRWI